MGEGIVKNILIVVDMQNDFIDGSLGTSEAISIVPGVIKRIAEFDGAVYCTKDTHSPSYLKTLEGSNLPIQHCIKGTDGWRLNSGVEKACLDKQAKAVEKDTFGAKNLPAIIAEDYPDGVDEIEVIGLCTDVCVISNAMILKAFFSNVPITVDGALCAGVTVEGHETALEAMRGCQINVK